VGEPTEYAVGGIDQALLRAAGLNTIAPYRQRLASLPRNLLGEKP
jgi:hypothetical protein